MPKNKTILYLEAGCSGGRQDATDMMVCAIIYTHNSAVQIENLVLRTRSVLEPDIYVLDDNSTDDTVEKAKIAGAKMLSAATSSKSIIIDALRHVKDLHYTHAVLMNANDPNHVPEHIPRFISAIWEAPHSIYVASGKQSKRASLTNALLTASAMCSIKDAWNSFRVYPIEEVLELNCKESGNNFAPEALVRASWAGIRTKHIELDNPSTPEFNNGTDANAIFFSVKLFGGMLVRFPSLLLRRLAI